MYTVRSQACSQMMVSVVRRDSAHSMAVAKRYATCEDLEQVPDTKVAELIDGDLIVSPRPASPHARSAMVLGDLLGGFDGPPGASGPVLAAAQTRRC